MSHFDNSGSEDGQLRSPGDDDFLSDGDQGETADSLDIKPPQAVRDPGRKKPSTKDKKHSREHKHKDRDRMIRDREKERDDDRRHRHSGGIGRGRDRHTHRREHYEREHEYHSRHKAREREKRIERDLRERNKRKTMDQQYENKSDAERALEDLRSRLLSKRNKYEKEIARYDDGGHYDGSSRAVVLEQRREHRDRRDNIIEVIDSPEHYSDYTSSNRRKDRKIIHEDPEQAARRAKLLEAEREMARRKEVARQELEARRERQRREDTIISPHHKTNQKRHIIIDESVDRKKTKRSPKEEGEYIEKTVLEVSDNSNESTEEEEIEDADDSDSDSGSVSVSNESQKARSADEEEILPGSPLSVGELTKSEHRRHSLSRSRSQSVISNSHSHSERSKSNHSRSRSKSRSRSHTRSEGSVTKSESRSRSGSRSPSRSHSQSLSPSEKEINDEQKAEGETQNEQDDNNEVKMIDPENKNSEGEEIIEKSHKEDASPRDEKGEKLPNYYPGIQGCRSVEEFQCLNRIEEGTYGVVYRAKDKRTNEIVALKRLKMEKEKEGFPITSLREINTLLKGQHPNIVTVREIVVGSNMDKIFIVMDYVEHDLKSLMETMKNKEQSFFPGEVKCLAQQLLRAVAHLHDNWILHRDLKTSNLLLSHKGILKVGDFGLAREYGSPLKAYTSLVVTLWYRAPELLLCSKEYSTPIDMWSVGCIFAEFLQMGPLFPGKSEIDQLNRIFKELGTPNEKIWPGYKELPAVQSLLSQNSHFTEYPVSNLRRRFFNKTTELGFSLLQGLLTYDPKQRLTADQALKNPYFKELPLPIDPSMFPTWPAKSELGARKALACSPKPPSGGSQFKQLGRDEITATNNKTGFVLTAGIDQRQLAMGPGFNLKF